VLTTIAEWLGSLDLPEYEQRFAENGIDDGVLPHLTEQDLKDMDVLLGHRRKMLVAIAQLAGAAPSATAPQPASVPEPKPQDTAERRQLSVMFCDLVGSTALSTKLDPEDLRGILSSYHRCVADLVERNGGFVAKYMGDGVLAYFGYPRASEHDAERAVRAGLALVEAVLKLATNAGAPLQVRVGIGTGLVVVGDLIGTGAAQEQAVVGETPNLAARLQAAADPGAVVIGPTTRRLLGNLFDYHDLGGIEVKGFAAPVQAFQVLGAGTAESRFEALRTANTPLVGREEEIDLLMRRWEQAKGGDGQVVLICGEPGIGKSRISQAILERISTERHTRLRYFCSPHHQDSAFYPTIAQFERAAGFQREDTPEQRLTKLETVLAQGANDLSEAAPLFADLLSIPTGDRYPPLNLSPQKRKEKTLQVQLAQVEGLAARQPVLMVFEDVHWSDPTTREVLDLLVDRITPLRVLVVLTFRPEFTPPWTGRPHVTFLTLSRLAPRLRAQMIGHMTGGKALPKEIADQIINRTDGVPLFIEELTKTVVESGIVAEEGDRFVLKGPVAPLAIPTSLHASLLARLDRLAPTREVAQIGAALGRSFSHELISAVAQMPAQKLDDALSQLVSAELIFRRGTPPDAEYTFKHALVQDAAYSTLLRSRRQQIHARIAATLERQFPEIAAAQPALMAQHCAEAGLNEQAVIYWHQAGQQAVARSAMTEAVTQLQKGLDQLASLPDNSRREELELDLQITLAPALIGSKGYSAPELGETHARASALAERLGRSDHLLALLYGQWAYHCVASENRRALPYAERLEQWGEARNDTAALMLGHFGHAASHLWLGEFVASRAVFEQCRSMDDPAHRAAYVAATGADQHQVMLGHFGQTLTCLGHIDQGRALVSRALSEARRSGHFFSIAFMSWFAASLAFWSGSFGEAKHHAEEMMAVSTEHDFPLWMGYGRAWYGYSMTELGQPEAGLEALQKAIATHEPTGTLLHHPLMLTALAQAHHKHGQPTKALNCLAEAEQMIERTEERWTEVECHRVRGDILVEYDDPQRAEESYIKALSVARRQGAKLWEFRAATSLARLWRDQGKRAEAHDLLAPVYAWFTEGFNTPFLKEAKALLDELSGHPSMVSSIQV
jgi:class 3 adenylate cyclase/tetratricopeptide (TPR) repeat protein